MGTPPLEGRVAVVAGAARGAGRGIARMLGEAGATVYCTGRSTRASATPSPRQAAGRPETIEETAEMVTAAGGVGIPIRVDHTRDDEVAALFQRVAQDHKRVDVLANVITGDPASWKGFLEETPGEGRTFVDSWVWPHISTAWHAARIMVTHRSGLIVELVEQTGVDFHGAFYFDLMETLLKRHIFALAHDLGQRGVTAVAVEPGFMRTEAILDEFGVSEGNWRDGLEKGKEWGWGGSETPCFVGRAVAALAADGAVARWNGRICTAWDLSAHYGFTDIDGSLPEREVLVRAQDEAKLTFLAPMVAAARSVRVEWRVAPRGTD